MRSETTCYRDTCNKDWILVARTILGNGGTKASVVYGFKKFRCMIQNLVTSKEYFTDITHLKPFYFDPQYVTPLNIATRDTDESVVLQILEHDFSDTENKLWTVQWYGEDPPSSSWENHLRYSRTWKPSTSIALHTA